MQQKTSRQKIAVTIAAIGMALAALWVGTAQAAPSAQNAPACAQTYIVQKGDWLSTIALRYLGTASGYTTILDATNAAAKSDSSFATIANANRIEVGMKLCIPPANTLPGREMAGIYTTTGPAADASGLVETLVLGADGQVRYTLLYIGKAQIDAKGTWKQEGDTVTVSLYEQAGKATQQTMTFTVKDGNLVAANPPNAVYAKTAPDVAFLSGLYTMKRPGADVSEILYALTLLPNGDATLNAVYVGKDTTIAEKGTWKADGTKATVNLTEQDGKPVTDNFVFEYKDGKLVATEYNKDSWGAELSFTKDVPPAEPVTPANPGPTAQPTPAPTTEPSTGPGPVQGGLAPITGSYSAQLPAADAVGRVIVLELVEDNKATLTTQFIGKGEPIVVSGTWAYADGKVTVQLTSPSGPQNLTFVFQDGALVLQDPVAAGYGSEGLTLKRAPSGNTRGAEFGGVTFRYDAALAQSAQGATVKAVPVQEGPALGGGTPAAVRLLFNGQKVQDFFDPHLAQVIVYKAADWAQLDPTMAQAIQGLQTLFKDKPTEFPNGIPLFPPQGAQQVFRVKPHYLNFVNGSGVAFVTYYAQDVSPVTADRVFYSFQGLTNDGKYLVTAFWPVTTALLPKDTNAGLGGQSYEAWAQNYTTYLSQLTGQLNALLPAAFTPNLNALDALVTSIEVSDQTLE